MNEKKYRAKDRLRSARYELYSIVVNTTDMNQDRSDNADKE